MGWQTSKGSYWVNNTLTHALTEAQMLEHRDVHRARARRITFRDAMATEREQVGVVGVGWVGLVTATCFAELGHGIIALDVNEEKVESLRRGEVTIHEPGLAELLVKNAERITFTTSMDDVLEASPAPLLLRGHAADLLGRRRPLARPLGRRSSFRRTRSTRSS